MSMNQFRGIDEAMGNIFSPTHLIVILLIILILFGRGKVSELMGDVAKGIKAFKSNMKEEEGSPESEFEVADYSKTIDAAQYSQPLSEEHVVGLKNSTSSNKARKDSAKKE
ncbi:sec-independent protein translocase protein TatA [Bartonella sp. CDC_skunk]|uniref:Sec-independent protein translocase protein TatA n=2 Tax=Bartonella rochalimae ATCC BAA-1498 TaxID=685782 RepID=A0A067W890_9HYPH|nr:sec-independent protein translocase protein TatA [Bartonella sp. A1379B]AQX21016.1 sec-independent protein translocase protein TatA [Bartonella sp. CDC_skunk]AQX22599.1 sec-independent protein translocase protein TatA [Bartonella sp. 11B]AQX24118.1 sec-independent protein translocase protein TatA [Bartonella sp. 114]AQX25048.1 sec-independent protein translocase protein TatA [Bartonella sp. Coyote22sub2]AQX26274.1 sec-independent protein translocase protein TatA [Bartonella sp. Raccoon60]K